VSFATITLCVASQRVFIVYFIINSVQKLLDTPSYIMKYGYNVLFQKPVLVLSLISCLGEYSQIHSRMCSSFFYSLGCELIVTDLGTQGHMKE